VGGLETITTTGSGAGTVGVVSDAFGNILGGVGNGAATWNSSRVNLYGPAEGYSPPRISLNSPLYMSLAWRTRSVNAASLVQLGVRPYDPQRCLFLSDDPLGHESDWALITAHSGNPAAYFDADGRCVRTTSAQLAAFEDAFINGGVGLVQLAHYGVGYGANIPPLVEQGTWFDNWKSPLQRMGLYNPGSMDQQIGESAAMVAGAYAAAKSIPWLFERVGNWWNSLWTEPKSAPAPVIEPRGTYAPGEVMPNGQVAGIGPGAAFKGEYENLNIRPENMGQLQGREFRVDQLETYEFDPNVPNHVRGWLRQERRLIEAGRRDEPRTPPGYVQAHGRDTPAREGFDYSNSRLQGEDLNILEEAIRRRKGRE
jgi:hypothetical protein